MIDRPTELALFAGGGIGILAAHNVGFRTVGWCENDPYCYYALNRLWPDAHPFKDIRNVTAEQVLRHCGRIDLISGGFPCQDISTAGRGEGLKGERSGLFFEIIRLLSEMRKAGSPVRYVFLENVAAIKVRGIDRIVSELESLDYQSTCTVVGAWAVGAPHRRNRLWLVARMADARYAECKGRQRRKIGEQHGDGGPPRRLTTPLGGIESGVSNASSDSFRGNDGLCRTSEPSGDRGQRIDSVSERLGTKLAEPAGSGRRRRITPDAERCVSNRSAGGWQQDLGDLARNSADGEPGVADTPSRRLRADGIARNGERHPDISSGCIPNVADAEIIGQREPNDATGTVSRIRTRTRIGGGSSAVGDTTGGRQSEHRDERGGDGEFGGAGRAVVVAAGSGNHGESLLVGDTLHEGLPQRQIERRRVGTTPVERTGGDGHASGSVTPHSPVVLGFRPRWPAGPGEQQHEWEPARLAEFGLGSDLNELARSVYDRLDGSCDGVSDQEITSAARGTNKVMLRMLGNGWCYPNAVIVYQWLYQKIMSERPQCLVKPEVIS